MSMRGNAGLTLVETVVATLLVTILALAVGTSGRTILSSDSEADRMAVLDELGMALLDEIASKPYDDPTGGESSIGPELGEWNPPLDRTAFDDVDDYDVWDGSLTLQDAGGTTISMDYRRRVQVDWVAASNFASTVPSPSGYKRIRVTVFTTGGDTLGTVSTIRAEGGRRVDD